MTHDLTAGLKLTRRFTVDGERTIDFLGSPGDAGARVYATPSLIRDIEQTCRDFVLEHLGPGEDTLGTEVDIKHLAPTLLGMWADIHIEITRVDGRLVTFSVTVSDPIDAVVASGTHQRFIIEVSSTLGRLKKKAEAFEKAS